MFLGDDVIHLVREERCRLRRKAVLARAAGTFLHEPPESRGDVGHGPLIFASALPLAMRTRCSAYW